MCSQSLTCMFTSLIPPLRGKQKQKMAHEWPIRDMEEFLLDALWASRAGLKSL